MNSKICLALPKGMPYPDTKNLPIEIVFMEESEYASGIDTHVIEGVEMKIYNVPKTIADFFVYYGEVGEDIAFKSIQDALLYNRCLLVLALTKNYRTEDEASLKHPECYVGRNCRIKRNRLRNPGKINAKRRENSAKKKGLISLEPILPEAYRAELEIYGKENQSVHAIALKIYQSNNLSYQLSTKSNSLK